MHLYVPFIITFRRYCLPVVQLNLIKQPSLPPGTYLISKHKVPPPLHSTSTSATSNVSGSFQHQKLKHAVTCMFVHHLLISTGCDSWTTPLLYSIVKFAEYFSCCCRSLNVMFAFPLLGDILLKDPLFWIELLTFIKTLLIASGHTCCSC